MALRSSVSQLSAPTAPRTAPIIEDQSEVEAAAEQSTTQDAPRSAPRSLNRYAGASQPAAEQPEVAPATAARGRGRPRKALGTTATAEAPAAKPARKARVTKAVVGDSPKELREALKQTEIEILILRDQVAAATARFQPRIDALRTKHAELSAQLSTALLK